MTELSSLGGGEMVLTLTNGEIREDLVWIFFFLISRLLSARYSQILWRYCQITGREAVELRNKNRESLGSTTKGDG